jgi:C_GCAxxG_C_C family probable redox protein
MQPSDQAASIFQEGFNCSQSVFSAFAPQLGLEAEIAHKIAAPFGGGMGRTGGTCGAVTGALMALGLANGLIDPTDPSTKENVYAQTRQFFQRFQARHGALACRDLLGFDISTPEGQKAARQAGVFTARCPEFVRSAAEIAREFLGG